MTRRFWVLLHRYAGLYMALFLIVSGITGSLIAFYDELDRAVNPHLYRAVPRGTALDAPGLIERAETLVPEGRVTDIILHRAPGESAMLRMEPRLNPATGEPYVLDFTEFYLDPYSGEELGRRRFGDLSQGLINLMPFIYRFHYGLALGEIGTWL
ncbi:MAG: PepSY-associated TM helix domain-containing protein, partial [Gammaproteobacteria bacterium]